MGALDHAVTLSGRLVRLRPISRDDYPALFGWRSSLETVHMLNFRRRVGTYEEFVRELAPNQRLAQLIPNGGGP